MSEASSAILKVLGTETGKYISQKLFSKLEKAIKSNTTQREANQILETIAPIREDMKPEIFERISDRYLTFRTLLSRDEDVFIDEVYQPLRIRKLNKDSESIILADSSEFYFPKVACIIGKAGQGKTTILRKIFLNYIKGESGVFPIIITLRKINWTDIELSSPKIISDEFKA